MISVHARYGYRRAVFLPSPPQRNVLLRLQVLESRRGIRRSFEPKDCRESVSSQSQRALRNRAGPIDHPYGTSYAASEQ